MKKVISLEVVSKLKGELIYSAFRDALVDAPTFYSVLAEIPPSKLFPGTVITIEVPECPTCKRSSNDAEAGKCPCGHDWEAWTEDQFKEVLLPGEAEGSLSGTPN